MMRPRAVNGQISSCVVNVIERNGVQKQFTEAPGQFGGERSPGAAGRGARRKREKEGEKNAARLATFHRKKEQAKERECCGTTEGLV